MKTPKTKREMYEELIKQGWPKARIARAFGVTRQAIDMSVGLHHRIPAILKFHSYVRDSGRCSYCGEPTRACRVVDESQPITMDNIGLLCPTCSRARLVAARAALRPPVLCKLPGCGQPVPHHMRYCSPEHKAASVNLRKEETRKLWATMTEKTCSRCHETKPIGSFYPMYGVRSPQWCSHCKQCQNKAVSSYIKRVRSDPENPKYADFIARSRKSTMRYYDKMRSTPEGREELRARSVARWQVQKAKMAQAREARLKDAQDKLESPAVQAALEKLKRIL